MHILIVGGRQDKDAFKKDEWHAYREAIVVKVDGEGGPPKVCLEYRSPPEACPADQDPSILFKAGTLHEDRLYLCTQTELLVYDLPQFHRAEYLSVPCFNDLHHVRPTPDGTLLVAVTGLDLVVELSRTGEVIREWGVLGQNPWERFSRDVDYRHVLTTKPHHSHPNFTFYLDGEIWVTRFHQRDAACLTTEGMRMALPCGKPHDGCVSGEWVYFTTVEGHVVRVHSQDPDEKQIFDLNAISACDYELGWCRGLAILDDDRVVVGFSRLRPTRIHENVRWVQHELGLRKTKGRLPTRIACYDLAKARELWAVDLEGVGMNAVFSIHPVL